MIPSNTSIPPNSYQTLISPQIFPNFSNYTDYHSHFQFVMTRRSTKQPKSRKRRFRLPKNSLANKRLPKPLRSQMDRLGFEKRSVLFLDGSFIIHCYIQKLDHRKMENMIDGMELTLSATDCTWKEVAYFVNYFTEHLVRDIHSTMELSRIECGHTDKLRAKDCIMSLVGEKNEIKAFIASHDSCFLKKLAENPLIPVVVVEGGDFALKRLSKSQRKKLNLPDYVIEPDTEDDPDAEDDHEDADEKRLTDRVMFYDLARIPIEGDGNCLLRALSEQITHSQDDHEIVRNLLANQIRDNEELYKDDVQKFMNANQKEFGLDPEYSAFLIYFSVVGTMTPVAITIQAASDLFKTKIVCITSWKRAVFLEFTPHDVDDPDTVWYLSQLAAEEGHTDSLYPKRTPSEYCRHRYNLDTLSL